MRAKALDEWIRRDYDPKGLVDEFVEPGRAVLFVGPPGRGKSTLVAKMADVLKDRGIRVRALGADPGSPLFGVPGAVSRARRVDGEWHVDQIEALCTLDASRYRLPVIAAVSRLQKSFIDRDAAVLVDAPGVFSGTPARELLPALASVVDAAVVIALSEHDQDDEHDQNDEHGQHGQHDQHDQHASTFCEISLGRRRLVSVPSHPKAVSAGPAARADVRTASWDVYLGDATSVTLRASVKLCGAPPPLELVPAWPGRQVGLLDADGRTLGLGEVEKFNGVNFVLRAPSVRKDEIAALVVRDSRRRKSGRLRTDARRAEPTYESVDARASAVRLGTAFTQRDRPAIEMDAGGAMSARVDFAEVSVVGGLFEDPSAYARFRRDKRGLLFDLGEVASIPPKLIHRVSDVMVTHAHFDHFSGFVDFLRRWVHCDKVCRVWGPPGLADQVLATCCSFTWDRIEEGCGPVFEVGEIDGDSVRRVRIDAARGTSEALGEERVDDGILVFEPMFRVRACSLEHGTTSIAYALEETAHFAVRSDRLEGRYAPGKWLGVLKRKAAAGLLDEPIELEDGSTEKVGQLADQLLIEKSGEKIVYATDFADTADNRRRIIDLARGAKVLICEASFRQDDEEFARHTRHLTTTACAEIARDAGVERLVPFHFSSRYESAPEELYAEILEIFDDVIVPNAIARRLR